MLQAYVQFKLEWSSILSEINYSSGDWPLHRPVILTGPWPVKADLFQMWGVPRDCHDVNSRWGKKFAKNGHWAHSHILIYHRRIIEPVLWLMSPQKLTQSQQRTYNGAYIFIKQYNSCDVFIGSNIRNSKYCKVKNDHMVQIILNLFHCNYSE